MQMDTGEGSRGGRGRRGGSYRGRGRGDYSTGGRGPAPYNGQQEYYGGGYPQSGYSQSYGGFDQRGYRGGGRGRGYWGGRGGRSSRGGGGGGGNNGPAAGRGKPPLPEDVEALSELKGHKRKVTCLALDQATAQLFTGSWDGTVRVWSCATGQCTSTVEVGGEVDSMLIEAGFLFVGVKATAGQGQIKAWQMASNQQFVLEGHTGRVQCLAAAGGMLFSGGQDETIRVWKVNPASGAFECTAVLKQEHGGHSTPLTSMCAFGPVLFTGDTKGHIKVWDLTAGVVRQTLERAHSGRSTSHPAVMSMLLWEGHLVTGSLDGYIKIWEPADPASGQVINATPVFTYPDPQQQQQQGGGGGSRSRSSSTRRDELPGVLSLCGVADAQGKSVIMVSYNGQTAVKLWELPTFADRGSLPDVSNVRSMAGFAAGRLMMSGDENGRVKVWRWKEAAAVAAPAQPGGLPPY